MTHTVIKFPVHKELLQEQRELAFAHPKRRSMYIIVGGEDQPVQAFLNTFMPDSYARPHTHIVRELFECLSGHFKIVYFDKDGKHIETIDLRAGQIAVVPALTYHTAVCMEEGTIYETKECFYEPGKDKEFAPWGPEEGTEGAALYLDNMKRYA